MLWSGVFQVGALKQDFLTQSKFPKICILGNPRDQSVIILRNPRHAAVSLSRHDLKARIYLDWIKRARISFPLRICRCNYAKCKSNWDKVGRAKCRSFVIVPPVSHWHDWPDTDSGLVIILRRRGIVQTLDLETS